MVGKGDATVADKLSPSTDNNKRDKFNWSVAQAAPLRRVYSTRNVSYDWAYGWASGGYTADCYFEGNAKTESGQQYFTRNSVIEGDATGTNLNNFNIGVDSASLPTEQKLSNNNGYSNWSVAGENDGQQVITNITQTPKSQEKPFLFIDDDGEYRIFVPSLQENTSGVSWGDGKANDGMGAGKIMSLDDFYIAKEGDTAKTINEQLEEKNIFFTPGIYHAEEVIKVNNKNRNLLGTGMATIIPDNEEAAMEVADKDGIIVSGLIFDAGTYSKYLLKIGSKKTNVSHEKNPILLQDLFFRIGGTTSQLTKADNALEINSNDVLCDHFWIWRADHGAGVEWYGNESQHGLIINDDNVSCYALFNEHFKDYDTLWNGENGATYFYQNEKCYDPISQEDWMSHNGTVNGYAAYKVANNVKNHYAVGLGIYNVFIYTGEDYDASKVQIQLDSAIEVPNVEGVLVENACIQTFAKADGVLQKFNHIINGAGDGVSSGKDTSTGEVGEGWARKFLISYNNGTAIVGKTTDRTNEQKGKYIGIETLTGVKQLGEEIDLDKLNELKKFIDGYKDLKKNDFTAASWSKYVEALNDAKNVTSQDYLKYEATQKTFDEADEKYRKAVKNLTIIADKTELQAKYDEASRMNKKDYTSESWNNLVKALADAKAVLDDKNAVQKDVDNVRKSLETAMNAMVKIDTTALKELIAQIMAMDLTKYTENSVSQLKDLLKEAENVLTSTDQTKIDAKYKELQEAVKGLEEKHTSNNSGTIGSGNSNVPSRGTSSTTSSRRTTSANPVREINTAPEVATIEEETTSVEENETTVENKDTDIKDNKTPKVKLEQKGSTNILTIVGFSLLILIGLGLLFLLAKKRKEEEK